MSVGQTKAMKGDLFMDLRSMEVFQVDADPFQGWYSLTMIGLDDQGRSCVRDVHESRLLDNSVYQALSYIG